VLRLLSIVSSNAIAVDGVPPSVALERNEGQDLARR
jgi:hypothetical protein